MTVPRENRVHCHIIEWYGSTDGEVERHTDLMGSQLGMAVRIVQ